MKICLSRFIKCALLLAIFAAAAAAQTEDEGKNEISVWGGFSPDSSTVIKGTGRTEDAQFGIVGLRYARRFNNNDTINLKYTADFIPAAILSAPDIRLIPTGAGTFRLDEDRRTAYGFGVAPLGLQMNFRPRKKLQPFVGASGGLLYFNKRIPNDLGERFSFTADVGAGAEYRLRNGRAVTFGYKFYHISNGGRGVENLGIDNNVFYVGYTFFNK